MIRLPIAAATLLLSLAGQGHAQQGSSPLLLIAPAPKAQALDLSIPRTAAQASYEQASAMRAAAFARTSVDARLADDRLIGSFGFLCGLQPSRDGSGGAQTYGYDPHGRFVGAKLSRAF